MLLSMTGYASNDFILNNYKFILEIKCTNNRFFDLRIKMSNVFNSYDSQIRDLLKKKLIRGSVDFNLKISEQENIFPYKINEEVLNKYLKIIEGIVNKNPHLRESNIVDLLKLPEVIQKEEIKITKNFNHLEFFNIISSSCDQLLKMQEYEGGSIEELILKFLEELTETINAIEALSASNFTQAFKKYKEKLEKLLENTTTIDENRILIEAGILSDKIDIKEEIDRVKTHINHFLENIKTSLNCGRILDFILQELNREFNTIGSKSILKEINFHSIEAKSIIEKIKEQIQNVK